MGPKENTLECSVCWLRIPYTAFLADTTLQGNRSMYSLVLLDLDQRYLRKVCRKKISNSRKTFQSYARFAWAVDKGRGPLQVQLAPSNRVEAFPNNFLSLDENKLYCKACSTGLGLKKSTIVQCTDECTSISQ